VHELDTQLRVVVVEEVELEEFCSLPKERNQNKPTWTLNALLNTTYENVASSCAACRRVVVIVGHSGRNDRQKLTNSLLNTWTVTPCASVRRVARRADVRRVAADLEEVT